MIEVIKRNPKAHAIIANLDGRLFSSQLGRIEVIRTFNRFSSEFLPDAYDFFEGVVFVDIEKKFLRLVENYGPEISLKTADAIHVSTAQLTLEDDDALVTFDKAMAKNAKLLGLNVIAA